jgi:hypothetical protein
MNYSPVVALKGFGISQSAQYYAAVVLAYCSIDCSIVIVVGSRLATNDRHL